MPRRSRIRTAPLEDLARQQRFSPPRAILKQITRAEALALEVDPEQSYPEEWVIFRITGYRPASATTAGEGDFQAAIIPGAALVGDLSAFVERLCDDAALTAGAMGEGVVTADELCARWRISRKTLERYRRRGLVARRTRDALGHVRLVYARSGVEAFELRNTERLGRAAAFARMSPRLRDRIVRGAELYARRLGWSLNQAAGRLAQRYRLGHETTRQVLLRHDESSPRPIFDRRPPLSVKEQRLALRAYERGITPRKVALRLGRTTASVHRVINQRRAARLRRIAPPPDAGVGFELEGIERSLLAPLEVNTGFGAPFPSDPVSLAALARAMPPVDAGVEHARCVAMRFVWWRATRVVGMAGAVPLRSSVLDRAETDLRWALRLKTELLRAELPVIVRAVEERLGKPISPVNATPAASLLAAALGAASGAIDRHDPMRGGRLAAPVSLAIARALAHPGDSLPGGRYPLVDWSVRLSPWQPRFEPDARLRSRLLELSIELRTPIALRFGWGVERVGEGSRPHTRQEVLETLGLSPQAQMAALRRALSFLRAPRDPGRA